MMRTNKPQVKKWVLPWTLLILVSVGIAIQAWKYLTFYLEIARLVTLSSPIFMLCQIFLPLFTNLRRCINTGLRSDFYEI
jgi:hypothetical protein